MSDIKNNNKPDFPGQRPDEIVELVFHQHPLVMRKVFIWGLIIILLGVVPLDFPQIYSQPGLADIFLKIALVIPFFVFAAWFYRWVGWYYTVYIVTNQRIVEIHQKGFFDRSITEWQHNKIMSVNYRVKGFQAVIFGFGDITAQTFVGDLVMPTIHKPVQIHAQLQDIILRGGGGSAADQSANSSTPNRI